MNFLAHLVLAEDTAESLIGNLAGDFVKGRLGDELPPAVRQGIVEHRRIDSFTDTHPDIGSFRRIIAAEHGHYARVIGDIFLDHFLVTHFEEMTGERLSRFLGRVWKKMDPHVTTMPGRMGFVYERMRDERWIESYGEISGIRTTLRNVAFRFSRRPDLTPATVLLEEHRPALEHRFRRFFPEVRQFADSLRR
jgi:acyl carrier protein phosphodiesterase